VASDGTIDAFAGGHWVGHAEDLFGPPGADGSRPAYTFPSGSQQISLDLSIVDTLAPDYSRSYAWVATGHLVFGEGVVPTPAAGVVYPEGIHPEGADLAAAPPVEGFSYSVMQLGDPVQENGTLPLGYYASESYADWCSLQPARYDYSRFAYDCITPSPEPSSPPATGWCSSTDSMGAISYDCRLSWLCQACSCSTKGCTGTNPGDPVTLLLMRSGDDLVGTFVRLLFDYGSDVEYLPVGNVRFKRQPE
jgi:hypothetical protein